MTPPPDQRLALDGLLGRMATVADQAGLVRFVGEALRALLRREGDAAFRATIETAFANALAVHTWEDQKALAAEVIEVVITTRPEIAQAWQEANAASRSGEAPARRAADRPVPPAPAAAEAPPADRYGFAAAEAALGAFLATCLSARLEMVRVPPPRLPSVAYRHDCAFFLFDPAFAEVVAAFVAGPLLRHCREGLEHRVYRVCPDAALADPAAWTAFATAKQEVVLSLVTERLDRMAAAAASAGARQAAAVRGDAGPAYRVVEKQMTVPRVYSVLGVRFTLGTVTTTRRVKVRLPPPGQLDAHEQMALDLLATWREMAGQAGIDLPERADFLFLRALLSFDTHAFLAARDEMMGLASDPGTSHPFMMDRFQAVDAVLDNVLADILGVMLFTRHGDGRFTLPDFTSFCMGGARGIDAVIEVRPFSAHEICLRPFELAVQVREIVRRRAPADQLIRALDVLFDCWSSLGRTRFGPQLDQGLAVLDSFSVVFADDAAQAELAEIGRILHDGLVTEAADRTKTVSAVLKVYQPLLPRQWGLRR